MPSFARATGSTVDLHPITDPYTTRSLVTQRRLSMRRGRVRQPFAKHMDKPRLTLAWIQASWKDLHLVLAPGDTPSRLLSDSSGWQYLYVVGLSHSAILGASTRFSGTARALTARYLGERYVLGARRARWDAGHEQPAHTSCTTTVMTESLSTYLGDRYDHARHGSPTSASIVLGLEQRMPVCIAACSQSRLVGSFCSIYRRHHIKFISCGLKEHPNNLALPRSARHPASRNPGCVLLLEARCSLKSEDASLGPRSQPVHFRPRRPARKRKTTKRTQRQFG